ncbi:hypothetical protein Taro_036845 [Colocasia esculenta]|uniref:Uncharacterized protein n=1 Tax=Colocasia esculenta TaxID=4460 RepID=A0A843WHI3_COLES|nr:hypothetical protein [Colocasia esculenta]
MDKSTHLRRDGLTFGDQSTLNSAKNSQRWHSLRENRRQGTAPWERPIARSEAEEEEGDGARTVACPKPPTTSAATAFCRKFRRESSPVRTLPAVTASLLWVHCLPTTPLLACSFATAMRRRRVEARGRRGFFPPSIGAREAKMWYRWDRTPQTDKEMLQHMTVMHKGWRGMLKSKERMTQMTTHSLQSDDAAPVSAEDAFIAVMGRDRPGRVRCAGKAETLRTWYRRGEGSISSGGYHTQVQ